jgi:hypothetical protein
MTMNTFMIRIKTIITNNIRTRSIYDNLSFCPAGFERRS